MIADHAQPPSAYVDRAIAGPDRADSRAATSARFTPFDNDPNPLNRRGRRHLAAEIRRTERSIFRTRVRQENERLFAGA